MVAAHCSHLIEWLRFPGDMVFIIFGASPLLIAAVNGWLGARGDARHAH